MNIPSSVLTMLTTSAPQNAALLFIGYQPAPLAWARSMDRELRRSR